MSEQQIEAQIQAAGKTASRVTPTDLDNEITSELYFTAGQAARGLNLPHSDAADRLTFCVLTLRNGFTVTGESACVSAENFDPKIGQDIARKNAREKLWSLLGFRLADKVAGL